MNKFISKPYLKAYSGLFINFSAAWFALVVITPNFVKINSLSALISLTMNIVFGIVCLFITAKLEEIIEQQ